MNSSAIAIYWPSSQTVLETANLLLTAYPSHTLNAINNSVDSIYFIDPNVIKIGIERQGNPDSRMFQSLKTFVAQGCDIVISSCLSRSAITDMGHHPVKCVS